MGWNWLSRTTPVLIQFTVIMPRFCLALQVYSDNPQITVKSLRRLRDSNFFLVLKIKSRLLLKKWKSSTIIFLVGAKSSHGHSWSDRSLGSLTPLGDLLSSFIRGFWICRSAQQGLNGDAHVTGARGSMWLIPLCVVTCSPHQLHVSETASCMLFSVFFNARL